MSPCASVNLFGLAAIILQYWRSVAAGMTSATQAQLFAGIGAAWMPCRVLPSSAVVTLRF